MGFMKHITGELQLDQENFCIAQNQDFVVSSTLKKMLPPQGERHTAGDTVLDLRKAIFDLASVKPIHIDTTWVTYNILGKDPEKWHPKTHGIADHGLPYMIARALLDGEISVHS